MVEEAVGREGRVSPDDAVAEPATSVDEDGLLLIEEISIDGMCGVY